MYIQSGHVQVCTGTQHRHATNSLRQLSASKKYKEGDGTDFEVMSDSFKADKMYA